MDNYNNKWNGNKPIHNSPERLNINSCYYRNENYFYNNKYNSKDNRNSSRRFRPYSYRKHFNTKNNNSNDRIHTINNNFKRTKTNNVNFNTNNSNSNRQNFNANNFNSNNYNSYNRSSNQERTNSNIKFNKTEPNSRYDLKQKVAELSRNKNVDPQGNVIIEQNEIPMNILQSYFFSDVENYVENKYEFVEILNEAKRQIQNQSNFKNADNWNGSRRQNYSTSFRNNKRNQTRQHNANRNQNIPSQYNINGIEKSSKNIKSMYNTTDRPNFKIKCKLGNLRMRSLV